jgi:hypothetical protein
MQASARWTHARRKLQHLRLWLLPFLLLHAVYDHTAPTVCAHLYSKLKSSVSPTCINPNDYGPTKYSEMLMLNYVLQRT